MRFVRQLRGHKTILSRAAPDRPGLAGTAALSTPSNGSGNSSINAPYQPGNIAVGLCKQTVGRVINGWLILTAVVGSAIALADGLTRAPNPLLELPPQPLEYEPYRAAFLLAGSTLPLIVAYAKKARTSLSEGLLLWFVFCTTAYMKDFSYFRSLGAPVFVTDILLMILLLAICFSLRRHSCLPPPLLITFLTLFIAAGGVAAARGFTGHGEPKLVFRDFALIAYALFLPVGYCLVGSWQAFKRVAVWFVLGAALSVECGLGWFLVAHGDQRRFVFPGIYVLVSLVGVLMMMANRLVRPRVGWMLVALFSLGLLLANMRSLFLSLALVLLASLLVPGLLQEKIRSARLVTYVAGATLLTCLSVFFFLHLQAGRGFATRVADNVASGALHTSDDPYWQFRVMAWKDALRRFQENPLVGEGFGIPFNFEIWDNDPRPHNTFLTVLYKMGLLGFLPLFALLGCFFWLALRAAYRHSKNPRLPFLQIAILAEAAFCFFGGGNLLLESPYLAPLFWAGIGASLRMIRMLDLERSARNTLRNGCAIDRNKERLQAIPTRKAIVRKRVLV